MKHNEAYIVKWRERVVLKRGDVFPAKRTKQTFKLLGFFISTS
jgi:hypothetical protein